jgi:hypothetical protein
LRIAHFFEGSLGREEAASAFLAMALEGAPIFRRHFFKLVIPKEYISLSRKKWRVKVEVRQIDVRMEADDTIILIENKVNAGAKQENQLLRYYLQEKKHSPRARFILVYLAPGLIGKSEIDRVTNSCEFMACHDDHVHHLSWETLADYPIRSDDIRDEILKDGLYQVQRIIAEARVQKYICEGDREVVRNIVKRSFSQMIEQTNVRLKLWSGRDIEQIFTAATNVTLWLDAAFEVEKDPPFSPINLRDEQGLIQITIRSQIKLEGKVKKNSELAKWWKKQIESKFIDIPGVGAHRLQENGWLVHSQNISGSEESLERAFVKTGVIVLQALSQKLHLAGFDLCKS